MQGRCAAGRRDKALVQRLLPEEQALKPSVRQLVRRWLQSLNEIYIKPEEALFIISAGKKSDLNSVQLSPKGEF